MDDLQIIWDMEDDEEGNYWHIVVEGHDLTQDEVEEVLRDRNNPVDVSRSSGQPIVFGWTSTGRHIAVVFENVSDDPRIVYPITAYEVPEQGRGKP